MDVDNPWIAYLDQHIDGTNCALSAQSMDMGNLWLVQTQTIDSHFMLRTCHTRYKIAIIKWKLDRNNV